MLRQAIEKIKGGMAGYVLSQGDFESAIQDLEFAVTDPILPVLEIDEQLSVLSGGNTSRVV
jgi:acetyl-CoA carboxylase/biotin carboxylase 1